MKKIFLIVIAALTLNAGNSYAGFLVKKPAVAVTATTTANHAASSVDAATTTTATSQEATTVATKTEKQQTLFSRIIRTLAGDSAEIPKGLYILLAIFPLGWLGMGINDNFEDYDWIISLLLYIIGWLPGVIYTLVKMKKYYN